ncbi:MAG: hypothetical protein KAR20_19735, partial [Candidatus Heimdallarchaeota archaeon]|nr:hypothetical protein [Candidatus Heimdallarchaeota archaeon]
MPRLLITTTIRNAKINQPSGYIYAYDLSNEKVIQRCPTIEPAFRNVDPNPRGGLRGGKGIATSGNQIFLANSVAVFRFTHNWSLINVITHPSCSGIHDILIDSDKNLWVTSARNDLLFKFDFDGNLLSFINFRNKQMLRNSLGWNPKNRLSNLDIKKGLIDFRDPRSHVLPDFDRAHVNSIDMQEDGSLLISLGLVSSLKFSVLMKIKDKLIQRGLWSALVKINQWLIKIFSIKKDLHSELFIQPARGKSVIVRMKSDNDLTNCFVLKDISVPSHSIMSMSDGVGIYLNTSSGDVVQFDLGNRVNISTTHITEHFLRGIFKINDDQVLLGS